MRLVHGKRYHGSEYDGTNAEEAKKFRDLMNDMAQLELGLHLGEFLPVFRWFDFSCSHKKLRKVGEKKDVLFQEPIDQHRNKEQNSNTMIGRMLHLQESQPEYYTEQNIKGLIIW